VRGVRTSNGADPVIRRLATIAFVLGACALVVVLAGAGGKPSESGKTVKIAFSNAFGLTEGGDLRVGGVIAGSTDTFDVSKGPECQLGNPNRQPRRTCAIVTAKVKEPGFTSFRKDATCAIRQQSLIGEYYVDCQPGSDKQELASNAIIPDTRTASTIPTDLVNNVLRRPYRDRLRLIIAELGTGLAGRPEDVAKLLKQAHPGLRETDKTLKILAGQTRIIKNFISNSDVVVAQLQQKKNEVARWIKTAGRTAEISATRRAAIAAGFQRLPTFLDELRPTMTQLGQLTDAQTPLLQKLRQSAPQLTVLFTRLGPFANASRPAFRSLGSLSVVGKKALTDSKDEIATLSALAADAPATFKPLRQFLQTLDDRKRSFDRDPRATTTAPPAPDPARANGRGFTGMEGIWNFFYWQTLSINQFDSISHFLRILAINDPNCSPYTADARPGGTNPNADLARQCASYLGPFQPGVTAPDPTANGSGASATSNKPVAKRGAPRGRGQAEAPPVKGQPDYSHPNPTLPPSVQELLNHLTNPPSGGGGGGAVPSVPGVNLPPLPGVDANQALDYLLGP
jgi:ABC-type transporter Mla subunit MlaD